MRTSTNPFWARSLHGVLSFFKEGVFSEEIASRRGFLQGFDPRLKVIGLAGVLVGISFVKNPMTIALFYAASLLLAVVSGIRIGYFVKRVWVFIPLFALVIAIPAFLWYSPVAALTFVFRVAASVSFAALVILTTKRSALFKALAVLGLPRVFLVTLDMMYTYLQLLVKSFEEMHLALKGRLARPFSRKESRRWIASRMSALYLRSYTMSREVYAAMVARGYTGEPKSLNGKERA